MGNIWHSEELLRYSFIGLFKNHRIIIFPQTVFYTNDEPGKSAMLNSISHYDSCPNMVLVAREKDSYDLMRRLYPNTTVLLTPDIVLSSTMKNYGVRIKNRDGILCVFRSDLEKSIDDSEINKIIEYIKTSGISLKITDMYADCSVSKRNRLDLVRKKMQQFADSKLVITDRLHGMIFSAITETPCIVFSNNNHKVRGTYEWLKDLGYIKYVESADEAIGLIPTFLSLNNCHYRIEKSMPHFEKLVNEIKNLY